MGQKINQIFTNIANDYDRMNQVISFGTHNFFKRKAVKQLQIKDTDTVLDLATGTGDLAGMINQKTSAKVIMADRNGTMLKIAKRRVPGNDTVVCDAANLPFPDDIFDKVMIGFGIRNFTHLDKSFENIYRLMKPGGRLVIIEFGQPPGKIIRCLRNFYFRRLIPVVSRLLIGKTGEYHYLAGSIINFHDQKEIVNRLENQSFRNCIYQNYLFGGIVVYSAIK